MDYNPNNPDYDPNLPKQGQTPDQGKPNQPRPASTPSGDERDYTRPVFDPSKPAADLPNHPSQPGHPNYPKQDERHIQPPPSQPAYPSLPGVPISKQEHEFLKASREKRAKKYAELVKLAAEIGATVSGYPTPGPLPHQPSRFVVRGGRDSGLTLDQEAENERFLDDTERNTLHREIIIKKEMEAAARDKETKEREVTEYEKDMRKPLP